MDKVNDLSFERLTLVSEYVQLQELLVAKLDCATGEICKAKTVNGLALSSFIRPSLEKEMEPTLRIKVQDDTFKIWENDTTTDTKIKKRKDNDSTDERKTEKDDKKPVEMKVVNFRPFGILEPASAKAARKHMVSAIEVICEIASVRSSIKKIEDEMNEIIQSLKKEKDICSLLSSLKVVN